jgi:hypothetical protein
VKIEVETVNMASIGKSQGQIEPEIEEFLSLLAMIAARVLTKTQAERDNLMSERQGREVINECSRIHQS